MTITGLNLVRRPDRTNRVLRKRGVLLRYYSNHEIEKLSFHNGTVSCGKNMFSYSRKKTLYIYMILGKDAPLR